MKKEDNELLCTLIDSSSPKLNPWSIWGGRTPQDKMQQTEKTQYSTIAEASRTRTPANKKSVRPEVSRLHDTYQDQTAGTYLK